MNMRMEVKTAKMNTVDFQSGGMPKRMQGTKANNFDDYKSRFDTMGLGSGAAASSQQTMQTKAQEFAKKALALGEAAGLGGARVPLVEDAAATMERMLDKFVNQRVDKLGPALSKEEKKAKKAEKKEKKKSKKKDKKKKDKKKKKKGDKKKKKKEKKKDKKKKESSSSSSSSSSSGSGGSSGADGGSEQKADREEEKGTPNSKADKSEAKSGRKRKREGSGKASDSDSSKS